MMMLNNTYSFQVPISKTSLKDTSYISKKSKINTFYLWVLIIALLAVMVHGQHNPAPAPSYDIGEDFCEFDCVKEIYDNFCGGSKCVFSTNTTDQFNALCSGDCFEALGGAEMFECLTDNIELDQSIEDIQNSIVSEVYDYCYALPPEEAEGSIEAYLEYDVLHYK